MPRPSVRRSKRELSFAVDHFDSSLFPSGTFELRSDVRWSGSSRDCDRVGLRDIVRKQCRALRGRDAFGIGEVLDRERDAVEGAQRLAAYHLGLGDFGFGTGALRRHGHEGVELGLLGDAGPWREGDRHHHPGGLGR